MPLFTITSDFGSQNYLSGLVKGEIASHVKSAQIIDISDQIAPYQIHQAAYIFKSAFTHFPAQTFHLMLCSLFHTRQEQLLVCKYNNSYVFGVDNGVFSMVFGHELPAFYALKLQPQFKYRIEHIARSFAMAADYLNRNVALTDIAIPYELVHRPAIAQPALYDDMIELQVLYIDNFKNVVLNITRETFETIAYKRNFRVEFIRNEAIHVISEKYNDVEEGKKLCLFNAAGYLEIAVYKGNAAELFGFETGLEADDIYKTVKIYFE